MTTVRPFVMRESADLASIRASAIQAAADLGHEPRATDLNRIADSLANAAMDLRRVAKTKASGRAAS